MCSELVKSLAENEHLINQIEVFAIFVYADMNVQEGRARQKEANTINIYGSFRQMYDGVMAGVGG